MTQNSFESPEIKKLGFLGHLGGKLGHENKSSYFLVITDDMIMITAKSAHLKMNSKEVTIFETRTIFSVFFGFLGHVDKKLGHEKWI